MSLILLTKSEGVATITLNRPEKLNSFAGTMRQDLIGALDDAGSDEQIRVIVITGAGRGFCAGGDVEAMHRLQQERAADRFTELLEAGRAIVTRIRQAPSFVIASVNGVAAGAGCNLALACDYRIASEQARFGETFVRIGLHPDWGGTYFLPRLVGTSRAMEMMMTGRMVDASEAQAMGLVDRVVSSEALQEETSRLARDVAEGPPLPIRDIKRAIYSSPSNGLPEQIALETSNQLRAFVSIDAQEGMAAFFDKRTPRFGGAAR